jgi:large subunit ribosomal protein L35
VRSLRQELAFRSAAFAATSRSFSQSIPRSEDEQTTTTTKTTRSDAPAAPKLERADAASNKTAAPSDGTPVPDKGPVAAATGYVSKDPNTVTNQWYELKLMKKGTPPIGSRRRRAAIKSTQNIPFEQLPYQAFQEARKILQEDRKEKIAALAAELAKIKRLEDTPADQLPGGERKKNLRLASLRKYVQELKILADINDPMVKKRFEDGFGTSQD